MRPDDSLEQAARKRGYTLVCGCDEAGAGPLMGPVCAGAVILPEGCDIPGLDDNLFKICNITKFQAVCFFNNSLCKRVFRQIFY